MSPEAKLGVRQTGRPGPAAVGNDPGAAERVDDSPGVHCEPDSSKRGEANRSGCVPERPGGL